MRKLSFFLLLLPLLCLSQQKSKVFQLGEGASISLPMDFLRFGSNEENKTAEGSEIKKYLSGDGTVEVQLASISKMNGSEHPAKLIDNQSDTALSWYDYPYFNSIRSFILFDPLESDEHVFLLFATQADDQIWAGLLKYPKSKKSNWDRKSLDVINSLSIAPKGVKKQKDHLQILERQRTALNHFKSGSWSTAKESFDKVIATGGGSPMDFYHRALCWIELGYINEAIKDLEIAGIQDKQNPDFQYKLGICLAKKGRHEKSMEAFNKSLDLNRHQAKAHLARGLSSVALGDNDGAFADFNAALVIDNKLHEGYLQRAYCRLREGDKDGACNDLNIAKELGNQEAKKNLRAYCQ